MLSDWSDHQVSLKLTLRYLKGARKQHSVVGGRWHHQSPPLLNTSARLLTLLNMFLCKHWYILLFLLPFVSRCLSAARPPPAAAAGDLLSLCINLCIFAKVEGLFRFYARRTAESSARHPCGKENRSAFPSGGGPKTSRAGPYHGALAFFIIFFLLLQEPNQLRHVGTFGTAVGQITGHYLRLQPASNYFLQVLCSLWASTCCSDLITANFLSCLTFSVDRDGIFCFCFC